MKDPDYDRFIESDPDAFEIVEDEDTQESEDESETR
jgi:hypothetical protein